MKVTLKRIENTQGVCGGCVFYEGSDAPEILAIDHICKQFPCEENYIEYIWIIDEDQNQNKG